MQLIALIWFVITSVSKNYNLINPNSYFKFILTSKRNACNLQRYDLIQMLDNILFEVSEHKKVNEYIEDVA